MQPLNPFLAAFFRSSVVAQCSPVHHYVLLVPLTDLLFTYRETEYGGSVADLVASDDFLNSHVLRIPPPVKDRDAAAANLRDVRGKPKKYSTLNGRSVLVRDSIVFTNKGFKTLAQAQILSDATWYPDVLEPRQWLLYYISKPLVGTWEEVKLSPAVLVNGIKGKETKGLEQSKTQAVESSTENAVPRKKDVRTFDDLLENFPMIARQMQAGLERLFLEFSAVFEKPLPPPPSASDIPDPQPMGPIEAAAKRARSESLGLRNGDRAPAKLPVMENFYAEDDEDVMRAALETAVTTAIDLFQGVDKQQLSLLGATTDLTGPLVEKLIERYVSDNVHHLLFPKLAVLKRPDDLLLEARIRKMEFIDVSQLGIAIDGGPRAKLDLLIQLGPVADEFKKISAARSPGDMMDTLLATTKAVSRLAPASGVASGGRESAASEKPMLTANADTLVSLLLFVVIRSQIRNLQARIAYVRNFIFVDDIESGEMGYALSTFEAVLAYLLLDSTGLYKASRRNKALWEATKKADLAELRNIMELSTSAIDNCGGDYNDLFGEGEENGAIEGDGSRSPLKPCRRPSLTAWNLVNGLSVTPLLGTIVSDRFSHGSDLSHVFPFQANGDDLPIPVKRIKRVAMDTRSMSSGSEISFQSRTTSLGTNSSAIEGDISVAKLAQTTDALGQSVLMMAVQHRQTAALAYLLSLSGYYPIDVVLQDMDVERTTLLSAATQLGHAELIDMVLNYIVSQASVPQLSRYLSEQDVRGRSVGHYLFHAPWLIRRIGHMIAWRQRDKNGQTPLFALCRSYDHADYHSMVEAGLAAARESQGDGQALHVDDHVDGKGNTLLHIINDARLATRILQHGDVDVNATNERRFTALMVASKYGRYDMVRCLFADSRVDVAARELRGLTAVELAKDDEVRNKIDDLGLFRTPAGRDGRITGVVRAFFVEDGSVRLVLKSAAPTDRDSYTVTTSRRSLAELERMAQLLALEHPASWIPTLAEMRSPFQLPTKPSRALLRDIQLHADWFLRIMLGHPTLATHEMLWEFFLVPELQLDAMEQRTRLKLETRRDKIKDEYEPVEDVGEVERFASHARDMVRSVGFSTKGVARRVNAVGLSASDLYDSMVLLHRQVSAVHFMPRSHVDAFEFYVRAVAPAQSSAQAGLHTTLLAMQSTVQALLSSLSRPGLLIERYWAAWSEANRQASSGARSSRWPLGILDETRQRLLDGREQRVRRLRDEAEEAARELRYTQQTVAAELAGWQEMHESMGRRAMREYARAMVVQERMRLSGMMRALRRVRRDK
ncbi:VPS9 domain protein [Ophiocordyceps camponoti-floridani]|uniref:VPS9 domain protein n=1 Tax=Ophiocordyceps camponoti-floridani TaxID=2030778 RepID=A0A8H4Q4N1_9HYPO|nr:VPS9 domain protein [Ophiocordyceps camponoti-floridani]